MLTLAILLEDSAREVPERTAIVCEETRMSYAELNAATNQVTHGLAQAGIQKGDTVALSCQDNPSFVIAYYGILKAGAAALPVEVMRAFNEKFNVKILEGYGLSETSPIAVFYRLDREARPGSIGFPVWGVEVRLVNEDDQDVGAGEVGEIAIRGHNVMKGYYKRPEATAEAMRNGWFHTGDMGRRGEDGYRYIVDRVKDMIIRGGFNVYPREIEEVLMTHPAVSLAAVVGVQHERHGA